VQGDRQENGHRGRASHVEEEVKVYPRITRIHTSGEGILFRFV
jgi:hypothetical protein